MSIFPSPFLAKLQDLKLWQGNYEALLQNKSSEINTPSDLDTIDGLSGLDSTRSSTDMAEKQFTSSKNMEWDKKVVTPSKPFAQLLEEKLAEDKPIVTPVKPKKPFLRKGSGLVRFRMTYPQNKSRNQLNSKLSHEKISSKNVNSMLKSKVSPRHENCYKSVIAKNTVTSQSFKNIELRMPDINIKPKGKWIKVQQNDSNWVQPSISGLKLEEENRDTQEDLMKRMNTYGLVHFLPSSPRKSTFINKLPEKPHTSGLDRICQNTTLENTERELRLFEALEERAEHSSFSSTSSSIIGILSSTPSKRKQHLQVGEAIEEEMLLEDHHSVQNNTGVPQNISTNNIQNIKKQNILHNFFSNLKHMGKQKEDETASKHILNRPNKIMSPDTTFSEPESNTETRSPTSSSFYTDFEHTFKNSIHNRIDVAVNTSFTIQDESAQIYTECPNCIELQQKLKEMMQQIPDIQAEKAKVCDFAKDLEKKRDQLNNEMQKMKKKYEKDIDDLKIEIDNEKKKFVREKAVFDMYIKEAQNRPTRKEREELSLLKKELIDIKELMKLKETKNGATQARLRNQIKSLEKERDELKSTVGTLQKENSKLNASVRIHRPSEAKMLQEINKNLTKLTEETFKKQVTKADQAILVTEQKIVKKGNRQDDKKSDENNENEAYTQLKRKSLSKTRNSIAKNIQNISGDDELTNTDEFENVSLEKQYETTFGQLSISTTKDNSLNDSKKEKVETIFPDGSKEVKYSNGNTKIISPDGNCITVRYYNGDIKEINTRKNIVKYFYSENCTWHTQYGDGSELLEYANGQKEKKHKDGKKEITCADGTLVTKYPDGSEEILYTDNSKMIKTTEGEKILVLPNGQREFHTKDHKRREYPDGTVKILYLDGTQETRYASGRVRIKDPNGVLIMDSNES